MPPLPTDLDESLLRLKLPHARRCAPEPLAEAKREGWEHVDFLRKVLGEEVMGRYEAIRPRRGVPGIAFLAASRRNAVNHYRPGCLAANEEIICRTVRCCHPWLAHFRGGSAGGSRPHPGRPVGHVCRVLARFDLSLRDRRTLYPAVTDPPHGRLRLTPTRPAV